MGQVAVRINGRQYQIACDDGQEDRLSALGLQLDQRVQDLLETVGAQVGEQRLLIMVSLLMLDELSELRAQINRLPGADPQGWEQNEKGEETAFTEALDLMSARLEAIADKLEAD